jgi:hypothetical protein
MFSESVPKVKRTDRRAIKKGSLKGFPLVFTYLYLEDNTKDHEEFKFLHQIYLVLRKWTWSMVYMETGQAPSIRIYFCCYASRLNFILQFESEFYGWTRLKRP